MWQRISKDGPKPAFELEAGYSHLFLVGRRMTPGPYGWVWSLHQGTTEYFWDNTLCQPGLHPSTAWTHWLPVPAIILKGDSYDVEEIADPPQSDTERAGNVPVSRIRTKRAASGKRVPVGKSARRGVRGRAKRGPRK